MQFRCEELCNVEHGGNKIRIEYNVKTKNGDTEIYYFLNPQKSSMWDKFVNDLPQLFFNYEANLIQMSKNIIERHNQGDKKTHKLAKKNFDITKSPSSKISQLKNDFSMLQSFKKRKITTFFESKPVAFTIVDIFGDMKTLVIRNKESKFFIPFHTLNVKFSEFIIASRLKTLINNLIRISEIFTISIGFGTGIILFNNFHGITPSFDSLETLLLSLAIEIGIPGMIATFARKWIGKKILELALNNIFDKLLVKTNAN